MPIGSIQSWMSGTSTPCLGVALLFITAFLGLSLCGVQVHGEQRDIDCLRSIHESVQDPYNYLNSTWNFDNKTAGNICTFTGVECWKPDENRVLNIKLANMSLRGSFPLGLANCTSLTGLDLSSNELSGPLPSNISKLVNFLTSLVLSSNNFSGQIPADLAQCGYLNVLSLDHNQFSGQIPAELGSLDRMKVFNVANNLLTGPIPMLRINTTEDDVANNPGLCGGPLPRCSGPSTSNTVEPYLIVGSAVFGKTVIALVMCAILIFRYCTL